MFNEDHKSTFTISKKKSWSPVSYNVIDLVKSLPTAEVVEVTLYDHEYDRSQLKFGQDFGLLKFAGVISSPLRLASPQKHNNLKRRILRKFKIDQTLKPNTLAQIQCIVKKKST
jgi:hypothetical protein